VNEHTIADAEQGVRKPRATTVARLAEALGLDPEDLLGKVEAPSSIELVKVEEGANPFAEALIGTLGAFIHALDARRSQLREEGNDLLANNQHLGRDEANTRFRTFYQAVADFFWSVGYLERIDRVQLEPLLEDRDLPYRDEIQSIRRYIESFQHTSRHWMGIIDMIQSKAKAMSEAKIQKEVEQLLRDLERPYESV